MNQNPWKSVPVTVPFSFLPLVNQVALLSVVPLLHFFSLLFSFHLSSVVSFPLPLKHTLKASEKDVFGNRYLEICEKKVAMRREVPHIPHSPNPRNNVSFVY